MSILYMLLKNNIFRIPQMFCLAYGMSFTGHIVKAPTYPKDSIFISISMIYTGSFALANMNR